MRQHAKFWAALLVPEWTIVLKTNLSNKKMTVEGTVCDGLCWWSTEDCAAQIWIRRGCQHPEETLVHELLHVRNEGHAEKNEHYDPMYERALNVEAEAYVRLRYGKA